MDRPRPTSPGFPLLERFTDHLITGRGVAITLALWLLAAIIANVAAARLPAPDTTNPNLPASIESSRADALLQRAFPGSKGSEALIVFARTGGLTVADRAQARALVAWLLSPAAPRAVSAIEDPFASGTSSHGLISRDNSTLIVGATIAGDDPSGAVDAIRAHTGDGSGGLQIRLTGPAGIATDAGEIFTKGNVNLELITVLIVLVLLGVVYRAPLLAITPVIAVFWAYSIAQALLTIGEHLAGISVNGEAAGLVTVLLFGAGTDYTLFIISRYRTELTRQADPYAAMRAALHGVAEVILASGGVVLLATLTLLLAQSGTYHDFGVALSTAVAVILIAGLTLIPSLLVAFRRAAFWPAVPRMGDPEPRHLRLWEAVGSFVSRRPVAAVGASAAVLVALATAITGYHERFDFLESFLKTTPSQQGYNLLSAGFGAGTLAPTQVLVTPAGGATALPNAERAVIGALAGVPHVASVIPAGASRDGRTGLLQLTFNGNPYVSEILDRVPNLRTRAQAALRQAGGGQVLVGGETATAYDTRTLSNRDTVVVVIAVLVLIAAVLGLLLRSAVAPLYLLPINALSYAAAFGLTLIVNRLVLHGSSVGVQFALDLFVFLSALGADYNIFLLSRVREEARLHPMPLAIRRAVAATGGVITSAGIILAGTFLVLAVLPARDVVELGIGVALGVLLDTFMVRALLVPGATLLLGRYAWWPSRIGVDEPQAGGASVAIDPHRARQEEALA